MRPGNAVPAGLLETAGGAVLIPEALGGEPWRAKTWFGTALSAFGICVNADRLADLGITNAPLRWEDLADPRYFGQLAVVDPTKSGSISKAFEMIIHQQCREEVRRAGYSEAQVAGWEAAILAAGLPPGEIPSGVPPDYQAAVERGWLRGVRLVQRIGANARYFTDSASKAPIDVSMGSAAAGIAIDFYGRFQAGASHAPDGRERMRYVTPAGGSSVSADPVALLRGAPHRETAVRFIDFVLSEDGQKLWNYRPGTPGGPIRYALRRLPIRRDFYPGDAPGLPSRWSTHAPLVSDDLGDPAINPYVLAGEGAYWPRWTAAHFNVQRDLIRAMCLDSADELKAAWAAIHRAADAAARARALELLGRMPERPEPLTWRSAPSIGRRHRRLDYLREWTEHFRASYREAEREAGRGGSQPSSGKSGGGPPAPKTSGGCWCPVSQMGMQHVSVCHSERSEESAPQRRFGDPSLCSG